MKTLSFFLIFTITIFISCKSQNKSPKVKFSMADSTLELFRVANMVNEDGGEIEYVDDAKKGFKDLYNKIIIQPIYQEAGDFNEGLAAVRLDNLWGFIDKNGDDVISFQYDSAVAFTEGMAYVLKKNKWGKIDKLGNTQVPFIYDKPYKFKEGLAKFTRNNKIGFINENNIEVIPPIYENALNFHNGLALTNNETPSSLPDYNWIDKNNKVVINLEGKISFQPVTGMGIDIFHPLAGYSSKTHQYFFYNNRGEVINSDYYSDMGDRFYEGLTWFKKDGLYGYLDSNGRVLVPAQYSDADFFYDNLASVKNSYNKFGYIDKTGKVVIPFIFDEVSNFAGGVAAVKQEKYWGGINKEGKKIIPFIHDEFRGRSQKGSFITFKVNGSLLEYNRLGIIIPPLINYTLD